MDVQNSTVSLHPLTITQWNHDLVLRYIWNPVFFITCLVIGLAGNGTVIFTYKLKMKKKMEERFFIPVLALLDLIACVCLSSFSIIQSLRPVDVSNIFVCKTFSYLQYASSASSLFMLLAIACHRYRMVCDPFGRQMSRVMKYVAMTVAIVLAYFLFVPQLFLTHIVTVPSNVTGLEGQRCTIQITSKTEKTLLIVFRLAILCTFVIVIVGMSLLYTLVAKTIIRRMKLMRRSTLTLEVSSDGRPRAFSVTQPTAVKQNPKGVVFQFGSLRKTKGHLITYRYSYMFITITISAVISYIVPLVLALSSGSSGSDVEKSLNLFILKRLYIICHIVNPFIYGAFDKTFRGQLKSIFSKCFLATSGHSDRRSSQSVQSSD